MAFGDDPVQVRQLFASSFNRKLYYQAVFKRFLLAGLHIVPTLFDIVGIGLYSQLVIDARQTKEPTFDFAAYVPAWVFFSTYFIVNVVRFVVYFRYVRVRGGTFFSPGEADSFAKEATNFYFFLSLFFMLVSFFLQLKAFVFLATGAGDLTAYVAPRNIAVAEVLFAILGVLVALGLVIALVTWWPWSGPAAAVSVLKRIAKAILILVPVILVIVYLNNLNFMHVMNFLTTGMIVVFYVRDFYYRGVF